VKQIDINILLDSDLPLPDEVRDAAVAATALAALKAPPPEPAPTDPRAVRAELISDCVHAASIGKPSLPDVTKLTAATEAAAKWREADQARRQQIELLKAAQAEARADVDEILAERHAETIHALAAELDKLMDEAREIVPKIRGLSVGAALVATDDVREAFTRFEYLAGRYSAIRLLQSLASGAAGGARHDVDGYFTVFKNMPALYPNSYTRMHAQPPWPADVRDFLIWCIDNPDHELWCPTPAERDAEHQRQVGAAVAGRMGRTLHPVH